MRNIKRKEDELEFQENNGKNGMGEKVVVN